MLNFFRFPGFHKQPANHKPLSGARPNMSNNVRNKKRWRFSRLQAPPFMLFSVVVDCRPTVSFSEFPVQIKMFKRQIQ